LPPVARLAGVALLLTASACATTAADAHAQFMAGLGARVLHEYMQPRTRDLRAATTALGTAVGEYCASPGNTQRARAEQALGDAVGAWAQVEFLRFGPLVEKNRAENFFFWPDPRGVVQRQMRAVLSAADPSTLAQLRQQSAAVQGLPALEYALHADDAQRVIASGSEAGRFRCSYAAAVASNLAQLAGEIELGWRDDAPLAQEFAQPGPSRNVYRSGDEVATEVLKTLSTALHVARDQNLVPALGNSAAEARSTLLPLHRSALTARHLAAGIEGLSAFHAAAGFATALPADSLWVDQAIHDELDRIQQDFSALQAPVAQALTDDNQRDLLVHVALLLANTRAMVDEYLAPALQVNLGFNSLDGD
jgi:predicted lipoprotein